MRTALEARKRILGLAAAPAPDASMIAHYNGLSGAQSAKILNWDRTRILQMC